MPGPVRGLDLRPVFQRKGRNIAAAEPGIGNPRIAAEVDQQKRMGSRRNDAFRQPQQHPRQKWPVRQPQCGKNVRKQPVLLEAISPAPLHHKLLEHAGAVDPGTLAERDREILEADCTPMRQLKLREPVRIERWGSRKADAGEVVFEVHNACSALPSRSGQGCG